MATAPKYHLQSILGSNQPSESQAALRDLILAHIHRPNIELEIRLGALVHKHSQSERFRVQGLMATTPIRVFKSHLQNRVQQAANSADVSFRPGLSEKLWTQLRDELKALSAVSKFPIVYSTKVTLDRFVNHVDIKCHHSHDICL